MAKLKEKLKELKEKQQKEIQEVQKDLVVKKIEDFPPAIETSYPHPVKKPKGPPIAFLDKYPKKKKKSKHNAVKFRLPEGSVFNCGYFLKLGEKEVQWRGTLTTPDREEPFRADHQSLHYLLTTLGQMWYKENEAKTKKEI